MSFNRERGESEGGKGGEGGGGRERDRELQCIGVYIYIHSIAELSRRHVYIYIPLQVRVPNYKSQMNARSFLQASRWQAFTGILIKSEFQACVKAYNSWKGLVQAVVKLGLLTKPSSGSDS